MKLSEISTERAADVLCELTPLVDSIITDEDLMQSLSAVVNREQTETMSFGQKLLLVSAKAGKIVPILMKKRRAVFCHGFCKQTIRPTNALKATASLRKR
jgi:hypothetical protein